MAPVPAVAFYVVYVPLRARPWVERYDTPNELAVGLSRVRAAHQRQGLPVRAFPFSGTPVELLLPVPYDGVTIPGLPPPPPPPPAPAAGNWLVPPLDPVPDPAAPGDPAP